MMTSTTITPHHDSAPVTLISGANRGIGLQVGKELAAEGFTVLVGSRKPERGAKAAAETGPDAVAIRLDVTDEASSGSAVACVRVQVGSVWLRDDTARGGL